MALAREFGPHHVHLGNTPISNGLEGSPNAASCGGRLDSMSSCRQQGFGSFTKRDRVSLCSKPCCVKRLMGRNSADGKQFNFMTLLLSRVTGDVRRPERHSTSRSGQAEGCLGRIHTSGN